MDGRKNGTLSPQQAQVLAALLAGHSWPTVAGRTGSSREDLANWAREEKGFEAGLQEVEGELYERSQRELLALRQEAINVIHYLLRQGQPADQLRAAELVLAYSAPALAPKAQPHILVTGADQVQPPHPGKQNGNGALRGANGTNGNGSGYKNGHGK